MGLQEKHSWYFDVRCSCPSWAHGIKTSMHPNIWGLQKFNVRWLKVSKGRGSRRDNAMRYENRMKKSTERQGSARRPKSYSIMTPVEVKRPRSRISVFEWPV
jgi:hypothetical protein